jgi:predicted GIY-YIG superfamily endonuclease
MDCVIYKITDINNGIYIGSTIDFHRRKLEHNRRGTLKLTKPYTFEIIREFTYNYKTTRKLLECWYILQYDCINEKRPIINKRRERKIFEKKNKKHIDEWHKNWRAKNPERIKKNAKTAYNNRKEILLKPTECECGKIVSFINLTRHRTSKQHLSNVLPITQPPHSATPIV